MINKKNIIGADETGVGDYLTPLVAAAVFVPEQNYQLLKNIGVNDSKKLTDKKILQIFEQIKTKIKSSVRSLSQVQYNYLNHIYNANELKLLLHLEAINALSSRLEKVDLIIIDQFASEKNIDKYKINILAREKHLSDFNSPVKYVTNGEQFHISVAAASIVARAHFLLLMEEQNKIWKTKFPFGTNQIVEKFTKDFIVIHGFDALKKVAKISFKTTQKFIK